ncbi:MAG TPA: GatB/YqeY domain-containing protein [Candidatus Magasanikbacteria bacterium]|nr:GatB/YqeY domain-containing protein [Candidatus Magasanikbacteria bacterium]
MSLRNHIVETIKESTLSRSEEKLSTLRFMWSQIRNAEIDKHAELNDEEIQTVISRLVKQQKDALKDFSAAGRVDLQTKTEQEIALLQSFLPEQISDSDLEAVVQTVIETSGLVGSDNVGRVMGAAMKEVRGRADGNRVREVVIKMLANT